MTDIVTRGRAGIRLVEYLGATRAGETILAPLPGAGELDVRCTGQDEIPHYHRTTGIHGFTRLQPGSQHFHIADRQRRFLPHAAVVEVGEDKPGLVQVAMRPAQVDGARRTGVTGRVTVAGVSAPFLRVHASTAAGAYLTCTDADGSFLAFLPAPPPPVAIPTAGSPSASRC